MAMPYLAHPKLLLGAGEEAEEEPLAVPVWRLGLLLWLYFLLLKRYAMQFGSAYTPFPPSAPHLATEWPHNPHFLMWRKRGKTKKKSDPD